jgi:hypothetical protein
VTALGFIRQTFSTFDSGFTIQLSVIKKGAKKNHRSKRRSRYVSLSDF